MKIRESKIIPKNEYLNLFKLVNTEMFRKDK